MMIFRLTKVEVLAIFAKSDDFLRSGLDRRSFYSYLRRRSDILVSGEVDCVFSLDDLRDISHAWASSHSATGDALDDLIDETLGDSLTFPT